MRKIRHFVAWALLLILCAFLIGCDSPVEIGIDPDNGNNNGISGNSVGNNSALQEYLDNNRGQVATIMLATSNDIFDFDLFVRGDAIVYSYKYKTLTKSDVSQTVLVTSLEVQKLLFQNFVNDLRSKGFETSYVIVEYIDAKGEVIYSTEVR